MIKYCALPKKAISCAKNSRTLLHLPTWRFSSQDHLTMGAPVPLPRGTYHKVHPIHTLTLSPFCQAVASLPPAPSASSAHKGGTMFFSTSNSPCPPSSLTAKSLGQNAALVLVLSPLTTRPSALIGTFEVPMLFHNVPPSTKMNVSTSALSVAARATMPSPGPATPNQSEDFLTTTCSLPLAYTDFSHSIIPCLSLPSTTIHHASILDHVIHPYNPDAFHSLLLKHGLLSAYPLLPSNLRHGFPLGHMPTLTELVILPNNTSTYPYMHDIHDYLQKELSMGRMSGPFSCEETELILHGPFYSSPLIVSLQPQQWGMPDKIRICRHLSKGSKLHPSVNSYIWKEDFPIVFESPVRSGYWVPRGSNQDRDWLGFVPEPKIT